MTDEEKPRSYPDFTREVSLSDLPTEQREAFMKSLRPKFTADQINAIAESAKPKLTPEQLEALRNMQPKFTREQIDAITKFRPSSAIGLAQAEIAQGLGTAYDATIQIRENAAGTATAINSAQTVEEAKSAFTGFANTLERDTTKITDGFDETRQGNAILIEIRNILERTREDQTSRNASGQKWVYIGTGLAAGGIIVTILFGLLQLT